MSDSIEFIFERWKQTMGHQRARLDQKRAKAIRAMLMAGYTVEDLELAIFGCSISPFHRGQNDRAQKYQDIALICRDAEHVDKFIALAEAAAAKQVRDAVERPSLRDKPVTPIPEALRKYVKL